MNVDLDETDFLKEYLKQLRLLEFDSIYPVLTYDTTPKLKEYIQQVLDIPKHVDRDVLFDIIKKIVSSYICFHTDYMDAAVKQCRDYTEACTISHFLTAIEETVTLHRKKQLDFSRDYLPSKSEYEKQSYDRIESLYSTYIEQYFILEKEARKPQESRIYVAFMKAYFDKMLKGESDKFHFTQQYLSYLLLMRICEIDISVYCNYNRLHSNLKEMAATAAEGEETYLIDELYAKNAELLLLLRSSQYQEESCRAAAKVKRAIDNIKKRIKQANNRVLETMEEEISFWSEKSVAIYGLMKNLSVLEKELENLDEQEQYLIEHGMNKYSPYYGETLGTITRFRPLIQAQKQYIALALFSVFDIKGDNDVWFRDTRGRRYTIDEYGHQVIAISHKKRLLHLDCQGQYVELPLANRQYYDNLGRYIFDEDGEKAYQLAPCSSLYKRDEFCGVFHKVTKDCGHAEGWRPECQINLSTVKKPLEPMMDYKHTLNKESIKFLWDTFKHILPTIFLDCTRVKPENPVQFFAHSLIRYKYREPHKLLVFPEDKKPDEDKLFQHMQPPYDIEKMFLHETYLLTEQFDWFAHMDQ